MLISVSGSGHIRPGRRTYNGKPYIAITITLTVSPRSSISQWAIPITLDLESIGQIIALKIDWFIKCRKPAGPPGLERRVRLCASLCRHVKYKAVITARLCCARITGKAARKR